MSEADQTTRLSRILIVVTAAAALAAPARGATAEPAPEPAAAAATSNDSAPLEEVTVTAHRRAELERRVATFVDQIAAQQDEEGLPRWRKPAVCPLVSGLPRQEGEFILGRLTEVAVAAGVPLAADHCRPNLYILVTAQPRQLMAAMEQRNYQFTFGSEMTPSAVERLIATPLPVKIWDTAHMETREGKAIPHGASGRCLNDMGSLIFRCAVSVFSDVFVVVDETRLTQISRGQFADYLAMVSLAKLNPDARVGDAPTILRLFNGAPQAAPAGMSTWDQAFLKSLYATNQMSKLQRTQITHTIVHDIIR